MELEGLFDGEVDWLGEVDGEFDGELDMELEGLFDGEFDGLLDGEELREPSAVYVANIEQRVVLFTSASVGFVGVVALLVESLALPPSATIVS
jgi:hypothetical protein